MTTENNKLLDYSESAPINLEQFKEIANTLSESDSISRRLIVVKELTEMLHRETWRLAGVIIKRSRLQDARNS